MTPTVGIPGTIPTQRGGRYGVRSTVALLLLLAIAGFGIGEMVISKRADAIRADARHRAEVILDSRAETAAAWLPRWRDATRTLRTNPTVQLFAATMAARGPGASADADLLTYLQSVFDSFATRRTDVAAARLLDAEGQAFLASAHAVRLGDAQRTQARSVLSSGSGVIGALRETEAGVVYDVFLPVFPAQALTPAAAKQPVAVMALAVKAAPGLAETLAPGRTLESGEAVALLQTGEGGAIAAGPNAALSPVPPGVLAAAKDFAVADGKYALAAPVADSPWKILYTRGADSVDDEIVATRVVVDLLIFAALACIAAVMGVLWWRHALYNSQQLTDQYKEFAAHLEAQHQLLNAINDAIAEEICVTGPDRRVIYANTAFANRARRASAACVGEPVNGLLPDGLALRFADWDAAVMRGVPMAPAEIEDAGGRWLLVSKVPFQGAGAGGVVTVARDVTDDHNARERQRRTMEATIRVLSTSVAAADPYLANHAERLRTVALGIADELACDADTSETLATTASVSQIGKIFLPRDLIRKETRLTTEQRRTLEQHIGLALSALDGIPFELPVPQTLALMHERLDGSGYPHGRAGAEIPLPGRILAVADVFAARTEPRAYRNAVPAADVIDILRKHPEKYDAGVVAALERFIAKTEPSPAEA